jgi:hypothetical protein
MTGLDVLEPLPSARIPYSLVDPFILVHEGVVPITPERAGMDTRHQHRGFDNLWYVVAGAASTGHSTGPGGAMEWAVFADLRNFSLDLAAAAGVLGSLTNTVGVLGMAVLPGYLPLATVVPILPQAIVEAILAAVVTVVVVRGVMLYRSGRTTAPESKSHPILIQF